MISNDNEFICVTSGFNVLQNLTEKTGFLNFYGHHDNHRRDDKIVCIIICAILRQTNFFFVKYLFVGSQNNKMQ